MSMEAWAKTGDHDERFDSTLHTALTALGIEVTQEQRALMLQHYRLVVEANRRFNLTRITSPGEAAVKHYADSLSLLTVAELGREYPLAVLDIGTGAGFPAVPLAIACPAWHVRAIDGTGKKAHFVAESARQLGLSNLSALHARAETMKREAGCEFDLVVMRAVMDAEKAVAAAVTFVAEQGLLVLYKTAHVTEQELQAGRQAAARHELRALPPVPVTLSHGGQTYERLLLVYARPD